MNEAKLAEKHLQFASTDEGFVNMILSDSATEFLVGSVIISAGASEGEAVIKSTMEAAVKIFADRLNAMKESTTSMNKEEWIAGIKPLLEQSIQNFARSSVKGDEFLRSIGIREEAIIDNPPIGARRELLIDHVKSFLSKHANDRERDDDSRFSEQYRKALGDASKEEIQTLLIKLQTPRLELPRDPRSDFGSSLEAAGVQNTSAKWPFDPDHRDRNDGVVYKTNYVRIIADRLKNMKSNLESLIQARGAHPRNDGNGLPGIFYKLYHLLDKIIPKLQNLDDEINANLRSVPINRLKDIIDEFAKIGFLGFNGKTDNFSAFARTDTVNRDAIVDEANRIFVESKTSIVNNPNRDIATIGQIRLLTNDLGLRLNKVSELFEIKYPAGGRRRTKKHAKKHHARTNKKKTHKRRANKKRRKTHKKRR